MQRLLSIAGTTKHLQHQLHDSSLLSAFVDNVLLCSSWSEADGLPCGTFTTVSKTACLRYPMICLPIGVFHAAGSG